MRCPKCHYLSFDPEPRCRNCGYGFSPEESDLLIRDPEPSNEPLVDLAYRAPAEESRPSARAVVAASAPAAAEIPRPAAPPSTMAAAEAPRPRPAASFASLTPEPPRTRPAPTTELPLFVKALTASEPEDRTIAAVEQAPARPQVESRPPLSVRRRAEAPASRLRGEAALRTPGPLDRDLLEDLQRIEDTTASDPAGRGAERPSGLEVPSTADRAGAGKRLAAAAVDAACVGGLAAGVLWITLRWCDLPVARLGVLPALPTSAFLLLVGLGYLLMFTAAGGQTPGKMVLGLRVVGDDTESETPYALTFRQAVYRSVLTFPSVLALGAGFVPALLGDERALHDRLSHTRVVRA